MKTFPPRVLALGTSKPQRAAFTLTELLVIIAIVAVLFSLMLPALAGAGGRSRVAQCGSNLKQFTMVLELYGNDNNNKLPQNNVDAVSWPLDFAATSFSTLIKYGATRNMVYCPANPDQNSDFLWFNGGIHVIGYAMTFPGPGLLFTNINSSLIPKTIPFGPILMLPKSSKRVLVADSIISQPGQTNTSNRAANTYIGIIRDLSPIRTSHLNGKLPAGGNLGMLDGHVEWRKFNDMVVRDNPAGPVTTPEFWW